MGRIDYEVLSDAFLNLDRLQGPWSSDTTTADLASNQAIGEGDHSSVTCTGQQTTSANDLATTAGANKVLAWTCPVFLIRLLTVSLPIDKGPRIMRISRTG